MKEWAHCCNEQWPNLAAKSRMQCRGYYTRQSNSSGLDSQSVHPQWEGAPAKVSPPPELSSKSAWLYLASYICRAEDYPTLFHRTEQNKTEQPCRRQTEHVQTQREKKEEYTQRMLRGDSLKSSHSWNTNTMEQLKVYVLRGQISLQLSQLRDMLALWARWP